MAYHMTLNNMALLEDGYPDLLVGLERKPYAALEGVSNIQRILATLNAKANRAKVEEIIDNEIVCKLDESGFIDSLYSKN